MRLIHLTDPHLSSLHDERFWSLRGKRRSGYLSWLRNRQFIHRVEILEQLTSAIESENADLILITGDLVHIGLESEIAEAAKWLESIGPPEKVFVVPGNHDNYAHDSPSALNRYWKGYLPAESCNDGDYTSGYPANHVRSNLQLIALNSSCRTPILSAAGKLGQRQRNDLSALLRKGRREELFQCVILHHPPFPGMTSRRKALKDDRALKQLFTDQPPALVLYGHLHRDTETISGGSRLFGTSSASSTNGASYRVFDLEQTSAGWNCEMRLMCRPAAEQETKTALVLTAKSSWSVLNRESAT